MNQSQDNSALETLARDSKASLAEITELFERERDALAQGATVTHYVNLLAVRRVRLQLQCASKH